MTSKRVLGRAMVSAPDTHGPAFPSASCEGDPPEARDEIVVDAKANAEESAWRARVKAGLAAQLEAGGQIYGRRRDGAYVVRTKNGDQITTPGHANI